jgi:tetratricopeptide (TPR) repeat protein
MRSRFRLIVSLLVAALLAASCSRDDSQPYGPELDDPNYLRGQQLERQNRNQEALACYLKVIAKRGDSAPESHLATGVIELRDLKDPIAAIYHFRKYLELQPNSKQALLVRQQIDAAKRVFASTLPAHPLENVSDRLEVVEQLNRLQRENEQLKAEIDALQNAAPISPSRPRPISVGADENGPQIRPPVITAVPSSDADVGRPAVKVPGIPDGASSAPASPPPKIGPKATPNQSPAKQQPVSPAATRGRTYTVQPHDTLISIARKYYGDSGAMAKVREILAANRDVLKSDTDLKPGMQLKIP